MHFMSNSFNFFFSLYSIRDPYDCKRFYRCYFNDEIDRKEGKIRIAWHKCINDMVFDETYDMCVLASTAAKCDNKEPEYGNIIKCEHEGYFRSVLNIRFEIQLINVNAFDEQ